MLGYIRVGITVLEASPPDNRNRAVELAGALGNHILARRLSQCSIGPQNRTNTFLRGPGPRNFAFRATLKNCLGLRV